jgi:hypothetical protein
VATAVAISLTLGIVGCAKSEPAEPSTSAASVEARRFKDSSAAGNEAQRRYVSYLSAVDSVSEAGGVGLERLGTYVTEKQLVEERAGAKYLKDHRLRVVGNTELLRFRLQSADVLTGAVSAYACVDFRKARVLDKAGKDVTPIGRTDRQTSIARFVWQDGGLVVSENKAWSGQSIC